ncbi:centromere protein T isoform X4 [Mustela erminea]|uniref:centromere protein T isoform X4 n=1 Tax=Mustela erminea TaxID=36723 RepID=UPI00138764A9|nr:centromere protein T isoform X4 [Mustela erminea]
MKKPRLRRVDTFVQVHSQVKVPPKPGYNHRNTFLAPLSSRVRTATPVRPCGSLARVDLNAAAGRRRLRLPQRLGGGWLKRWRSATIATASLRRARSCGACWILRIRTPRGDAGVLELGMAESCPSVAQKALLETPSSRRLSTPIKMNVRRSSYRARSIGRLAHVHTSGNLEEQTPRTLLKNIILTAPESSIMTPKSVVKPVPTPQVVRSSRQESSRGSLELQLPELEPPTTLALGLLAPGRRKQRLRLSVFQQEMDHGLPLSQAEPRGNASASSLTSSLSLTFASPLQPQSVQRPGLARRPPTRRAVDVGAFLQDLRDTSLALASPDPGKPAQLLAGKAKKTDVLAVSLPNNSSAISGEDGVEPLQDGVGEEAEERMEESLSVSEVMGSTGTQGSVRTEKSKGHGEMTEALEAKEPEGSSEDEDISGRTASPELASSTTEFLQARRPQFLEPAPPPSTTVLSSEPLERLPTRHPPRARTHGPRPRQDPHKTGLSHYVKLFSFYAKMPMEKKALEMVEKCLDKYFQHLCDDLEVFSAHAGRKTVRPEDLELLMRRQGLVNDQVSLHVLVERHLPLEYRQLLIPCAFSGNSVFPAQ